MTTIKSLIQVIVTLALLTIFTGCSTSDKSSATKKLIATNTDISPSTETKPQAIPTTSTSNPLETANNDTPRECNYDQTQLEINICEANLAQAADDKLNQVYQQLRLSIKDTPQEQKLITAEEKWVQFRDADCEYAKSKHEGGSIAPAIYYSCIAHLTKQRTKDLEEYLKQENL